MIAVTDVTWVTIIGFLWLASLVPVLWAIVDVTRRPPWQFSTVRKVLWALTLGLGWIFLWPLGLLSALWYLSVLRRRLPPASPRPGNPMAGHPYGAPGGYGRYGEPYGPGLYRPQAPPYSSGSQGAPGPDGASGAYGLGNDPYGYRPPPANLPPAGWYPDPAGTRGERWWDGRGWTDHLRTPSPGP